MFSRRFSIAGFSFALAGFGLTACGGAGAWQTVAPQDQLAHSAISTDANAPNLSGQYAGTVKDKLFGIGRIYANLVQYHDAVGGNFEFTYGSTEFLTPQIFLLKGSALTGAGESATLSLNPCAVSETATHGNQQLNGSYQAVSGCSGDDGNYAMKEQCRFVTSSFPTAATAPTACASGDFSPKFASKARATPASISYEALGPNLSGEYSGTVTDSLYGSGQIHAELVQYHSAVGGTILLEFGSTVFETPNAFLLSKNTLTGIGESATLSGVPCSLSETATHGSLRLNGSYEAVSGCSGENGTFTMKEVCRYGTVSPAEPRFALKNCNTL